jgi:transcriptional antiterminator NusG
MMMSEEVKTRLYAVKVTTGQEENVIGVASLKIRAQELPIRVLLSPPKLPGTIIVEAENIGVVSQVFGGMRHVKRIVYGTVDPEEVKRLLTVEEKVEEFNVGDMVEVVSGPFRDMKGKVVRAEKDKREVVIEFLDASFTLPVTITIDMLRKTKG